LLKHLLLKKWSSFGGSYAIVFGKKLQTFASNIRIAIVPFCSIKEVSVEGQGLTAVEKIFNKNAVGNTPGKCFMQVLTFVLP
jgi:aconitate hydratase 2/2-methylisocitrate dehydratase